MNNQLTLQLSEEVQSPTFLVGAVTTSASVYDEFEWINNNNFAKDAHKHTSCDWQLSKNEIWLGNTSGNKPWEKGVDIPKDYDHFKTIRLGHQAYCIKGKPLSRDYCLPLIIDKSEEQEYDRIYMKKMSAYAR